MTITEVNNTIVYLVEKGYSAIAEQIAHDPGEFLMYIKYGRKVDAIAPKSP